MPPPPAIFDNREQEWEVEAILDNCLYQHRLQYLVKWKGYNAQTWQPASDLKHIKDFVWNFRRLLPNLPRPLALVGARV